MTSRLRGFSTESGSSSAPKELKWSERVDLLGRLSRVIFTAFEVPAVLTEVISVINENISRQTNPHVVRAAIECMRVLGGGYVDGSSQLGVVAALTSCGMAWKTLLLDGIHTVSRPPCPSHCFGMHRRAVLT